jgi:hypothetical protein
MHLQIQCKVVVKNNRQSCFAQTAESSALDVFAAVIISLIAVFSLLPLQVYADSAVRDTSSVHWQTDGSVVPGSSSLLVRTGSSVSMTLQTSQLPSGHAATVLWAIFNHPEFCSGGHFGLRCGPADLSNPQVQASQVFTGGHIIGSDGTGNFGAHLAMDDTSNALLGPGLTNPAGADIHIIVFDHGEADPALMPGQINSANVCNPTCINLQAAAHEAK